MIHLVLASLLWSFSFGLIKDELSGVDPLAAAAGRLVLAAAVFAPLAVRGRCPRGVAGRAAALGSVQFGLMYVLFLMSFRWLPAWLVAALTVFTPLYVAMLAGRTGGRRLLAAAVLAVAGGAVVTFRGGGGEAVWLGVVLVQGSNLCFAWGQLRFADLRRSSGVADATLLGWMYAGAAVTALIAAAVALAGGAEPLAGWGGRSLLVLLYLGLIPTAAGFWLWNRGAARTPAGLLAVANNLKVPLAVIVAWTVFGEDADHLRAAAGLALVLAGLWLVRGNLAEKA